MRIEDPTDKTVKFPNKYARQRQYSFPPPTLNTQLPFKLEEEENGDEEEEEESSKSSDSFEVIK